MEEKKKNGRPTKNGNERKFIHSVRLTEEENSRLNERIAQYGGTASQFFRDSLFNKEIVTAVDKDTIIILQKSINILVKTSNNLNQITRKINSKNLNYDTKDFDDAKMETDVFISKVREIRREIVKKK